MKWQYCLQAMKRLKLTLFDTILQTWKIFSLYQIFSDILERNNDYSDTFNFRRGWVGEVMVIMRKVIRRQGGLVHKGQLEQWRHWPTLWLCLIIQKI